MIRSNKAFIIRPACSAQLSSAQHVFSAANDDMSAVSSLLTVQAWCVCEKEKGEIIMLRIGKVR